MAIMVAEKLGLDKNLIKQAKMTEMNWKAKRPGDSSLDVSKAASLLKGSPKNKKHSKYHTWRRRDKKDHIKGSRILTP